MITIRLGVGGILRFRLLDSAGAAVPGLVDGDFTLKKYITETDVEDDLSGTITEWRSGCYQITMTGAEADAVGQAWATFSDGTNEAHITFDIDEVYVTAQSFLETRNRFEALIGDEIPLTSSTATSFVADSYIGEPADSVWGSVYLGGDGFLYKGVSLDTVTGEVTVHPPWRFGAPGGSVRRWLAADRMDIAHAAAIDDGAATTTTFVVTGDIGRGVDWAKGLWVVPLGSSIAPRLVTAFDNATGEYTIAPALAAAPADGTIFDFVRYDNPYAQNALIADAVWDANTADHGTAGTFGPQGGDILSGIAGLGELVLPVIEGIYFSGANTVETTNGATGTSFTLISPENYSAADKLIGLAVDAVEVPTNTVVITDYDPVTGLVTVYPAMQTPLEDGHSVRFRRPTATLLDHPDGIRPGWDQRKVLDKIGATTAGKASGIGTTTEVYRSLDDAADAVTATIDLGTFDRTNVTYEDP